REDVRADLGTLLQHADRHVLALLSRQLLEPDRRGEPGWPATDDDDVVLHRVADDLVVLFLCHPNSLLTSRTLLLGLERLDAGLGTAEDQRMHVMGALVGV